MSYQPADLRPFVQAVVCDTLVRRPRERGCQYNAERRGPSHPLRLIAVLPRSQSVALHHLLLAQSSCRISVYTFHPQCVSTSSPRTASTPKLCLTRLLTGLLSRMTPRIIVPGQTYLCCTHLCLWRRRRSVSIFRSSKQQGSAPASRIAEARRKRIVLWGSETQSTSVQTSSDMCCPRRGGEDTKKRSWSRKARNRREEREARKSARRDEIRRMESR